MDTKVIDCEIIVTEVINNLSKYAKKNKEYQKEYERYKIITDEEVMKILYKDIENEKPTYHTVYEYEYDRDLTNYDKIKLKDNNNKISIILDYIKIRMNEID